MMDATSIQIQDIVETLADSLPGIHEAAISFLAFGEYTLNYRVQFDSADYVVRLVTGSQMNLPVSDQVAYEVHALELLESSGRTPVFHAINLTPKQLPFPYIVMGYLPGRHLNYQTDIVDAAQCIAEIHNLGVPFEHHLQLHPDPFASIMREASDLSTTYVEWPDASSESVAALTNLKERVVEHYEHGAGLFNDPDLALINTDLNTHNFIVNAGRVSLLDWEKARIGPTVQDLAYFLIPTTTLWRDATATRLSDCDEQDFLEAYFERRKDFNRDRYIEQLRAMKYLATLRAVSWCAWSVQAAASNQREIVNAETLNRSRSYLEPEFLDSLRF